MTNLDSVTQWQTCCCHSFISFNCGVSQPTSFCPAVCVREGDPSKGSKGHTRKGHTEKHPEITLKMPRNSPELHQNTLNFMTFSTFSLCPLWVCPLAFYTIEKRGNLETSGEYGAGPRCRLEGPPPSFLGPHLNPVTINPVIRISRLGPFFSPRDSEALSEQFRARSLQPLF